MKNLYQAKVLTTLVVFFVIVLDGSFHNTFGKTTNEDLTAFWQANATIDDASPAKYAAELKKQDVEDINSLSPFLASQDIQAQVLFSMSLLAHKSKPLAPETIDLVSALTTNSSVDFAVQKEGLRLLFNYYPNDPKVTGFIYTNLSLYCNLFNSKAADMASQTLFFLGEYAAADTNQEHQILFQNQAEFFLINKYIFSCAPGVMAVPLDNTNSIHIFLSAIQWPLYGDAMALKCAQISIGYFQKVDKIPKRLQPADFRPAVEFLLYKSKADQDFLRQQLATLSSSDPRLTRPILWILNEAKNSPVAIKALKIVASGGGKNKEVLQDIQSGKLTQVEAFDKPLEPLFSGQH